MLVYIGISTENKNRIGLRFKYLILEVFKRKVYKDRSYNKDS